MRQISQGLKDTGYVDKENVTMEALWAEGRYDRLPSLVTELVNRNVSVIAATGGTEPVSAARRPPLPFQLFLSRALIQSHWVS